jgi:AbrB family looped-hinge helix DNA binding protein
MKSIVGQRGQVVIPKPIRTRFGIRPGQRLDFIEEGGRLIVTKVVDDDPVASVYGTLELGQTTDEFIEALRGPAEFADEDTHPAAG